MKYVHITQYQLASELTYLGRAPLLLVLMLDAARKWQQAFAPVYMDRQTVVSLFI